MEPTPEEEDVWYHGPSLFQLIYNTVYLVGFLSRFFWQLFLRLLLRLASVKWVWRFLIRPIMFAFPDPETPHHAMIHFLALIKPLPGLEAGLWAEEPPAPEPPETETALPAGTQPEGEGGGQAGPGNDPEFPDR